MLITLMKFLNKNLLLIDRDLNENYYFFEKAQISIISSMITDLEMCIKNIKNIEIASDFYQKLYHLWILCMEKVMLKTDWKLF